MFKSITHDPLWEFGAFKDTLQLLFMNDDLITRLVMPELDDDNFSYEQNWKGGSYTINKYGKTCQTTLVGHCFTHPYIEETVKDTRTFICMETTANLIPNTRIKNISLQIYVYSHHDILDLTSDESAYFTQKGLAGNRCDMAMMAINRLMCSQEIGRDFGIGSVNFADRYPISTNVPNNKYYGRVLSYVISDFHITPKMQEVLGLI